MAGWDKECLRLYEEEGKTYNEIAKIMGLSWKQVNHALTRARKTQKQKHEAKVFADTVREQKQKILADHDRKMLNTLIKERAMKDIIADKVIAAMEAVPRREITPLKLPAKNSYREEEVVLQISDIQAGTYISSSATGGLNEYDQYKLEQQFKRLLHSIASIIKRHKMTTPIKKLNIHFLGDMVEGMGIFIGQAQHTDQDLYWQFMNLERLLEWFLIELLHLFDEIECSCIGGNHGRVGKKGENPHYVNWDVLLYEMLRKGLQNYERIKWNIPLAWWYVDHIQGHNFLLLHGDDIKAWNGIPFYGINRADAKWTQLLASKDIYYDYMELGHFHSPSELPRVKGEIIINGCWPGGSIFALKSLMTSGRPRQNIFGVHPEHGKSWSYGIWLD